MKRGIVVFALAVLAATPVAALAQARTGAALPGDQVQALIRRALTDPGDEAAFAALDGALRSRAQATATAVPPQSGPVTTAASAATGSVWRRTVARMRTAIADSGPRRLALLAGAVVLTIGLIVLARGAVRGLRYRSVLRLPRGVDTNEQRKRFWVARSLASNGLPAGEIALRTGLSRDALNLLLKLTPASRATAALPAPVPHVQSVLEAASDPLASGVVDPRFADGRLTYGRRA
ncbi:MAG: hypothetical protein D6701_07510 [Gemmatimonadetes bacterium]|nr:MAG: hypothetical protein D6701_07510 [Gemmatimonadota bacterium]